jgi:chromosome segregation ATPase
MIFEAKAFIMKSAKRKRDTTMTQFFHNLQIRRLLLPFLAMATFSGCASVQYSALEKVGIHKRDILVDRVEDARDSQNETSEQVVSAYEELTSLIDYDGGELEDRYQKLSKQVEKSRDTIDELDQHLEDIDRVSEDLFDEWESELDLYSSAALRKDQEGKLATARTQFAQMRGRMQVARDRVDPVMAVLNDNVLFLKHSLNARALASLKGQATLLEGQVDALIRDMRVAIDEADAFINRMRGT